MFPVAAGEQLFGKMGKAVLKVVDSTGLDLKPLVVWLC